MCLAKYDNVHIWYVYVCVCGRVWCSLHVLLCHLIMLINCVWEWYVLCVHEESTWCYCCYSSLRAVVDSLKVTLAEMGYNFIIIAC